MKKSVKAKVTKRSNKRSVEPELPSLVMAMAKLVERLEGLERKIDLVVGRMSNLPSEVRNAIQPFQRPQPTHQTHTHQRPDHDPAQGRRERMMYQAICADCCKNCEVPFKPTAERPVYCKECFAIRKAGHTPQDPDCPSPRKAAFVPSPMNFSPPRIAPASGNVAVLKRGKQKPARAKSKKKK